MTDYNNAYLNWIHMKNNGRRDMLSLRQYYMENGSNKKRYRIEHDKTQSGILRYYYNPEASLI